jgi:hypothetical protein
LRKHFGGNNSDIIILIFLPLTVYSLGFEAATSVQVLAPPDSILKTLKDKRSVIIAGCIKRGYIVRVGFRGKF